MIVDRDAKIAKLTCDIATLQAAVKQLLAGRGGGYRIPAGQGVLFPEAALAVTPTTETPAPEGSKEADDGSSGGDVSTAPPAVGDPDPSHQSEVASP